MMAQSARPNSDAFVGNYADEGAANTDIYQSVDEAVANDSDYIISDAGPSNSAAAVSLSSMDDPGTSAAHVVRYRYRKDSAGGAAIDMTIELREGYNNEVSRGTLIASQTHTNIGESVAEGSFTLAGPEADAITNYADLSIRIVSDQPNG